MGEQCPGESVEGIDVFDGQGQVDWPAVSGAGVRFAIIKATQGTYDTQTTFAMNWSHAKAAGVLRSAYHFFDPTEDGVAQAEHFLSVVGVPAPDDLPAMLDIECPDGDPNCLYGGGSGDAPATEITSRMWDFLRTVEGATAKKPVVYTFAAYLAESGVGSAGLSAYPLALAYPSQASCVTPPPPWAKATFWQYSLEGSVEGIAGPVDRDRFLGSLADLRALAGFPPPAAVTPAASSAPPPAPISPSASTQHPVSKVASGRTAGGWLAPHVPLMTALACALAVAPLVSRVLAGRTAPPCRRPTSAKA
jgi:lysozyme